HSDSDVQIQVDEALLGGDLYAAGDATLSAQRIELMSLQTDSDAKLNASQDIHADRLSARQGTLTMDADAILVDLLEADQGFVDSATHLRLNRTLIGERLD